MGTRRSWLPLEDAHDNLPDSRICPRGIDPGDCGDAFLKMGSSARTVALLHLH